MLLVGGLFSSYTLKTEKPDEISISQLVERVQQGGIKSLEVTGDEVKVVALDGSSAITRKESEQSVPELLQGYGVTSEQLKAANLVVKNRSGRAFFVNIFLSSFLPLIILIGVFWFMIRQMQGANARAMSF